MIIRIRRVAAAIFFLAVAAVFLWSVNIPVKGAEEEKHLEVETACPFSDGGIESCFSVSGISSKYSDKTNTPKNGIVVREEGGKIYTYVVVTVQEKNNADKSKVVVAKFDAGGSIVWEKSIATGSDYNRAAAIAGGSDKDDPIVAAVVASSKTTIAVYDREGKLLASSKDIFLGPAIAMAAEKQRGERLYIAGMVRGENVQSLRVRRFDLDTSGNPTIVWRYDSPHAFTLKDLVVTNTGNDREFVYAVGGYNRDGAAIQLDSLTGKAGWEGKPEEFGRCDPTEKGCSDSRRKAAEPSKIYRESAEGAADHGADLLATTVIYSVQKSKKSSSGNTYWVYDDDTFTVLVNQYGKASLFPEGYYKELNAKDNDEGRDIGQGKDSGITTTGWLGQSGKYAFIHTTDDDSSGKPNSQLLISETHPSGISVANTIVFETNEDGKEQAHISGDYTPAGQPSARERKAFILVFNPGSGDGEGDSSSYTQQSEKDSAQQQDSSCPAQTEQLRQLMEQRDNLSRLIESLQQCNGQLQRRETRRGLRSVCRTNNDCQKYNENLVCVYDSCSERQRSKRQRFDPIPLQKVNNDNSSPLQNRFSGGSFLRYLFGR